MTQAEILGAIATLDALIDAAALAFAQPELVPIADALAALAGKALVASRSPAPAISVEVAAADAAAQAAITAKFPRGL